MPSRRHHPLRLVVAVFLALAACGTTTPAPPGTTTPAATQATTAPDAPPSDLEPPVSATPPDGDVGRVIRVLDGDSLIAEVGGEEWEVRMLGINAPERDECHADEAREALDDATDDREVVFVATDDAQDRFGRRLRYVYAAGRLVNADLVAAGHGVALQSGHPLEADFKVLEEGAWEARLGMWAPDACGPPAPGRLEIVDIRYDPPGPDDDRAADEYVVLRNAGETDDFGGWMVRDESSQHRFRFPDGFRLPPGESVRVRSGCGNDGDRDLFWCAADPVWSNGGDTVIVQDPSGNVVDRVTYPGEF